MNNTDDIISKLTLKEKAYLVSGKSFWEIRGVKRLNIHHIIVTDGPHGIRKSENISSKTFSEGKSEIAICYPTASALSCSFNPEIIYSMGEYLAEACHAMNVRVLLGPGNNIKRSPLCGRNFEYFSEDPYLASKLASAEIEGLQSKGIGASLKHFVANNQEKRRGTVNAIIDERTLREIYLAAFEEPIKKSKPWTIMGAYNRVNGEYMCENSYLLQDILRDEWNYDGVVLTDWLALDEIQNSISNGLDLEMPTSGDVGPKKIIKAIKKGKLSINDLDRAVVNILHLLEKAYNNKINIVSYDMEKHHQKAREIAHECITLLKNDNNILPLITKQKIAVIGQFAKKPRYQGGGSSHINSYRVENIYDEFLTHKNIFNHIRYSDGYSLNSDEIDNNYISDAIEIARTSDTVILCVGLPDSYETEGIDRSHINMPPNHIELINKLSEIHDNIVLVISAGSVVKIPHIKRIKGVIFGWLTGEAGAGALVDIIIGEVNPSGKLSESFIKNEIDDPSYGNYPGNHEVLYEEGIFVGYRFHDRNLTDLEFEFGFGLSYTQFEYSDLIISNKSINDNDTIKVSLTVKNIGKFKGQEIVQLYINEIDPIIERPVKELKGFQKILLDIGESKKLYFELNKRSFAYYNVDINDWHINSGKFKIQIGKSSKNIILEDEISIVSSNPVKMVSSDKKYIKRSNLTITSKINRNTPMEYLKDHVIGRIIYQSILKQVEEALGLDDIETEDELLMKNPDMMYAMVDGMPLRSFVNATAGEVMSDRKLIILIFVLNLSRSDTILGKLLGIFRRKKT